MKPIGVTTSLKMSKAILARKRSFSCLHRYEVKNWSVEKNQDQFGPCFRPSGHGHNYEVNLYLSGPLDPESGMILNLADVDANMKFVLDQIDHKNLNDEIPFFKDKVPTTEALALYLFEEFTTLFSDTPAQVARLRLYEYDSLWVDVCPD